jgi:hypothetical protein
MPASSIVAARRLAACDAVESRVLPDAVAIFFGEHQVFEIGSPGRIRTSDQPVNSRLLYH